MVKLKNCCREEQIKKKRLTLILLSSAPVAKYLPSGLKLTERIYKSPSLPALSS